MKMTLNFTHFGPKINCNFNFNSGNAFEKIAYDNLHLSNQILKGKSTLRELPKASRDMNNKKFSCKYEYDSSENLTATEADRLRKLGSPLNVKDKWDGKQPNFLSGDKFVCEKQIDVQCKISNRTIHFNYLFN